ncbi:MAG: O-antigen ligase family protein [Bryobacterales bacterium]|nr:O-antigen ligase family protein [Bryobacterales bacterium]
MTLRLDGASWQRWVAVAAFGATAANFASIAASHALLGVGLLLLLLKPSKIRFPRIIWPVLALMLWTLVSVAASDEPVAALPQIKKFFVFALLPLIYTAFRSTDTCRRAAEAWFVVVLGACLLASLQFVQAAVKAGALDGGFYRLYVDDRVTGFYSHWMTFSQASVIVLLALACHILFSERRRCSGIWIGSAAIITAALVLSFTRSAWLALLAGGGYLLAIRRPRALLAVPVLLVAAYLAAPDALQQRVRSIRPGENQARIVMWRTGLAMIADSPLVGIGPERAGPLFSRYQPEDVRQLPPGFYGHLHNVYIHYAAERGIPAALIVIWLFGQVLLDLRRGLMALPDRPDDRRFLLHAGVCATLAIAILSGFDVSLGDSEVLGAYLAVLAVAYRGIPGGHSAAAGKR